MSRLFIALPIDESAGISLQKVEKFLFNYNSFLKIVPGNKYHITLKFLGETNNITADKIISSFKNINISKEQIKYNLEGIGAFPNTGRASVIWCGIKTKDDRLKTLHKEIENFAHNFDFKKDNREYKPHLTLARVKKNKKIPHDLIDYIRENRDTFFGKLFFKKIVLFQSKLTQAGPEYSELYSISFK